ncbi:hypothetical protein RJT34_09587 [Clitoria ternatea]|uniref:Polygalacturonase n=1 Tax=Clitoria ternatea TaxID=43366 RepID=A0AAN9K735_CLITE
MKGLFVVLFIFVIVSPSLCARAIRLHDGSPSSFNVVDFGALGDGQTDDSQAFLKAWQAACGAAEDTATLVIPQGKTFLLQPVIFQGPCKPAINVQHGGSIVAPGDSNDWKWPANSNKRGWIQFADINGLTVSGGGQFDGQGASWWKSAGVAFRPSALQFIGCKNLRLSSLTHMNSPRNHIGIVTCSGSDISNLTIRAPMNSPNTDGFDISGSSNILLHDCDIQTGDDCIAINSGSSFINITGVSCGPGHGISVGSLGTPGAFATAEEIHVKNCTFTRTENGVRIKTRPGGSGFARKITFEDIILVGAGNPVIIDQEYVQLEGVTGVKVSEVSYRNVRGTASGLNVVILKCDKDLGCSKITMDSINIASEKRGTPFATCTKADGTCTSCSPTVPCLTNQ